MISKTMTTKAVKMVPMIVHCEFYAMSKNQAKVYFKTDMCVPYKTTNPNGTDILH